MLIQIQIQNSKELCANVATVVALCISSAVFAQNTAFEKVMPATSSTVFTKSNNEQVVGVPPITRAASSFNLGDTPKIWLISDSSDVVVMLPDPISETLDPGEVLNPIELPVKKHKTLKKKNKRKIVKKVTNKASIICVPEKEPTTEKKDSANDLKLVTEVNPSPPIKSTNAVSIGDTKSNSVTPVETDKLKTVSKPITPALSQKPKT